MNKRFKKKKKTYKSGKVDDHAGVGDLVELVQSRAEFRFRFRSRSTL